MKDTPNGIPATHTFDPDSKEYKLSQTLAGILRDNSSQALGDILTTIEAATPEGHQLTALKQLVKERFWIMMDSNQHAMYYCFGIEPKQLRDNGYIQAVLDGKEDEYRKLYPLEEAKPE